MKQFRIGPWLIGIWLHFYNEDGVHSFSMNASAIYAPKNQQTRFERELERDPEFRLHQLEKQ